MTYKTTPAFGLSDFGQAMRKIERWGIRQASKNVTRFLKTARGWPGLLSYFENQR